MKKKKFLSVVLAICLLVSTMCVPVVGAEQDSKGLEQAIIAVKKIITIPDNYNEFTHYLSEDEANGSKVRVWRLNWAEKEGHNGSISASIDENGVLYRYNKYYGDESSTGLAKFTNNQAQKTAEEFLGKVINTNVVKMNKIDENFDIFSSDQYNFTYEQFVSNVPVNFNTISISVNKYSGEVTSFNALNPEAKNLEHPTLDGVIDQSIAEKNYMEKLGVDLKYYSYYDYNKKKMNIFAGYSMKNRNSAIDAKTGEAVVTYNENSFYKNNYADGKGMESVAVSSNQMLTKEETEAVKNVEGLITKEKAESIIRGASDIITSDMKINDSSLNKHDINDTYVWNISFDGAYGEVDAKSGELLSVNCYNNNSSEKKNISKSEGKNIAENFLKKQTSNKFSQTKYEDTEKSFDKISVDEGDVLSFNFVRQVNGIEFSNNSLNVSVNKNTGKIISYDNNWYDNVTFPSISQVMSKEAAFNKIKEFTKFELQYAMVDKNKVGLVYNFKDLKSNYIIDPISGIRLDYTGQAYKDNRLPEYTDISGHWCEKTVKELLENGYYIDGEKFNPNMNITQISFLKYIYSPMRNGYSDDEFYDMLIKNGVIKKEEKAPSSSVSNQEAAKFIIRYLGHDKIAAHPEIFNNPFKDNIEEQYKGYAAMCYALNIIKGDINGNFNGTHNISNAEAAVIIYNLLKSNTH